MDGSMLHWCLDSAEPTKPVSVVQHAHDQVVWTLDYHPLGYVLASGSKDYSTRFWCRARPAGGQERDRWHVGEAASQQFGTWKQQVDDDDQGKIRASSAVIP
jgi:polyadenylation factor subunit 2